MSAGAQKIIREGRDGVLVDILVQPRASRAKIGPVHGHRLKVAVTAPPVDGKANAAVEEALATALATPRKNVEVVSGQSSRRKTALVRGLGIEDVSARLGVGP